MEGKGLRDPFGTLLLGVLILCLIVAQNHVEANTACCQGPWGVTCYVSCSFVPFTTQSFCASSCGCILLDGTYPTIPCPDGYDYPTLNPTLENSAGKMKTPQGATTEFCKLGCASSVCNVATISILKNSGEQVVKEAAERCNNACSEFCTKGSTIAIETA